MAVAPGIGNANPAGGLSWVGLLMDYGPFPQAGSRREVADVSSYNSAYKRAALNELGDELGSLLKPGSPLNAELRARGGRFLHEPAARIDHLNVSRFFPGFTSAISAAVWSVRRAVGRGVAVARCSTPPARHSSHRCASSARCGWPARATDSH